MKSITTRNMFGGLILAALFIICLWGCKKQPIVYSTNSEVNITGYLDENPDQFSEFRKILDITGNAGYLDAYGTYTLFLPTNDAVKGYLQDAGKASVEDVDVQTLKNLVKFHLIEDTLTTASFKDGKLPGLTMYGQYLITGAHNVNGVTATWINRQANLVTGNIEVGNGIIHVIDHMLQPATQSLAQIIESNPDYSIFSQALKETGLYDTLNVLPADNPDKKEAWLTVLGETDSVYQAAGIDTYDALKAKYSNTGDPANPKDSLHLYMDYHILYDAKYLSDIILAGSHPTLAPSEVVTSKLAGTDVLLNDDDFNGAHEVGVMLNRSRSDISATNGVLHSASPYEYNGVKNNGNLAIKVRRPVRIDWDLGHFPEVEKMPAIFLKGKYNFLRGALPASITSSDEQKWGVTYVYSASEPTWWGDYLDVPLGPTARNTWYEFETPLIVKGKYKVWFNWKYYRKSSSNKTEVGQISIDGVPLQRTVDVLAKRPAGTDAELEAQGWKQYLAGSTSNNYNGRLLGTVNITSTDKHKLRITFVNGSSGEWYVDMIQFIPVDDDQIWPRFNADGTLTPKP